jgi:hypothetical protein
MKKRVIVLLTIALLMTSCQFDSLKLIHHEKPNIETDFSPFQKIGCDKSKENENRYQCQENSLLFVSGCDFIEDVPLLGGLTPNYPIALCTRETDEEFAFVVLPPDECLYANGFVTTYCHRYVIYKDGSFQLVKTMSGFRALFAPVNSPDEALGFVLATGWYTAKYDQTKLSEYVYTVRELEDTYVETTTDGYVVHVFYAPPFGCSVFETSAVDIKVTRDGQMEEIARHPVYHTKDTICVE